MLIHAVGGPVPDNTETLQTERFDVTISDFEDEGPYKKVLMIGAEIVGYLRINEHSVHLYDRYGKGPIETWPNSRREWEPALAEWLDVNISDLP